MNTNEICGNCVHWGNEKDINEEFRECQGLKHDRNRLTNPRYEGELPEEEIYDSDELEQRAKFKADNIAVTVDGSGYMAILRSKKDFGCRLFKSKD